MDSRHLVDPELAPMLDMLPNMALTNDNLEAARNARMAPAESVDIDDVSFRTEQATSADGTVIELAVYTPDRAGAPTGAILHVHGGGYVMGSTAMSDPLNRIIAHKVGCTIVSVEYRLAPETPHPGPVEDCYAGLKWLSDHAAALNVDPQRIAIKGESAGGGLAAGLGLLARDRGEVPVAFQCLTYPMIDDRSSASDHPYVGEFVWTRELNEFGWRSLLGDRYGTDDVPAYAAASRAEDLTGLPATWIGTCAMDLFLEENLEYARRLTRAGVPTELIVYPGAFHGFQMAGSSKLSKRYNADCIGALERALNG